MPPELPPELWGIIIDSLDDSCHAWFVLRAVSKTLRTITEDNFATRIKDGCTIRYAGGDERKIIKHYVKHHLRGRQHLPSLLNHRDVSAVGTFLFTFSRVRRTPENDIKDIVFKLCDKKITLWTSDRSSIQRRVPTPGSETTYTHDEIFFACKRGCGCCQDVIRQLSPFVRLDNKTRPLRLPFVCISASEKELSLNVFKLCHSIFRNELKKRRLEDLEGDDWIWWDCTPQEKRRLKWSSGEVESFPSLSIRGPGL